MKAKVFYIRLAKEKPENDQDKMNNFLENVTVMKTATEFITGQPNFWSILVFYDNKKTKSQGKDSNKFSINYENELTDEEKRIFSFLKQWRQNKATQLNIPSYRICHNTELMAVSKIKPRSLGELSKIKGFGEYKIAKYGDDLIRLLNSI